MDPMLRGAIIAAAVGLFMSIAYAGAKKPAEIDEESGHQVLRYPGLFKGLGAIVGFGMPIALIVVMVVAPFKNPEDPFIAGGMLLFFGVLGGCLLLESKVRIEVSDDGVLAWSPWSGSRSIKWEQAKELAYSAGAQWFVLTSTNAERIRVHAMMRGVRDFAEKAKANLSPDQLAKAEVGFRQVDI